MRFLKKKPFPQPLLFPIETVDLCSKAAICHVLKGLMDFICFTCTHRKTS